MTKAERKRLNEIYVNFGMNATHIHIDDAKGYKMVNRLGIGHLKESLGIEITYSLVHQAGAVVTVHGIGMATKPLKSGSGITRAEDFGETSPSNNTWHFPVAIAKKRCESRIVLEIAGLHREGFLGEDEVHHQPKKTLTKGDPVEATQKAIEDSRAKRKRRSGS